ncbi:MAG: hypothetical protein RIF33_23490 [Cyclobacteriaceae bacterium]
MIKYILSIILLGSSASIYGQEIPELNQQILTFVEVNIGQQVRRGECWDLVAIPLNAYGAKWDLSYEYGRNYNPKKEAVIKGDIIQFEGVKIQYTEGNTTYTETMEHHTAVVYDLISPTTFKIAHQNNGFSGRKVGISELDIETVKKGKLLFYRPVKM